MFELFRLLSGEELLKRQLPALGGAWVVAELFYKFHSFSLECLAFLVTWFVLDWLLHLVLPGRVAEKSATES